MTRLGCADSHFVGDIAHFVNQNQSTQVNKSQQESNHVNSIQYLCNAVNVPVPQIFRSSAEAPSARTPSPTSVYSDESAVAGLCGKWWSGHSAEFRRMDLGVYFVMIIFSLASVTNS